MKRSSWAWAWAITGCLFVGDATAQGLRQPFSVRPTGFDYNRYWQEDSASPSDAPEEAAAEAAAEVAAEESAPVEAAPVEAAPAVPITAAAPAAGCNSCADGSSYYDVRL